MPIVHIEILAGRSSAVKSELIQHITKTVADTLDVRPEQVRVLLYEVVPEHWAVGGRTMADSAHTARIAEDVEAGGET